MYLTISRSFTLLVNYIPHTFPLSNDLISLYDILITNISKSLFLISYNTFLWDFHSQCFYFCSYILLKPDLDYKNKIKYISSTLDQFYKILYFLIFEYQIFAYLFCHLLKFISNHSNSISFTLKEKL
jgi:hypothetical protein